MQYFVTGATGFIGRRLVKTLLARRGSVVYFLLRPESEGKVPALLEYWGVGKTRAELEQALDVGIGQFNLELEEEGAVLAQLAAACGKTASAVLRVNPDVDAGTHAKISTGKSENKFGVPIDRMLAFTAALKSGQPAGALVPNIGAA